MSKKTITTIIVLTLLLQQTGVSFGDIVQRQSLRPITARERQMPGLQFDKNGLGETWLQNLSRFIAEITDEMLDSAAALELVDGITQAEYQKAHQQLQSLYRHTKVDLDSFPRKSLPPPCSFASQN